MIDGGHGRGPSLYRYQPRTCAFLDSRWEELRLLPGTRTAAELGAGAAPWLRVNGMRGEQAEPALRAMLDRLYEDATSFAFPEERFERLYEEVETTLYRDAVRARVVASLGGVMMESERVDLGEGLALVAGEHADAPAEAAWPGDDRQAEAAVCACSSARYRLASRSRPRGRGALPGLVTALRLWAPGGSRCARPAGGVRGRAAGGRWHRRAPAPPGARRGRSPRTRSRTCASSSGARRHARRRARGLGARPLRDGLRARARGRGAVGLPARAAGAARRHRSRRARPVSGCAWAALCAEEGQRGAVQRRVEAALSLERFLMGARGSLQERIGSESPRQIVAEMEGHLRALLRDVLCGYLDTDLKSVADDILLETAPEPFAPDEERFRGRGGGARHARAGALAGAGAPAEPDWSPSPRPPSSRPCGRAASPWPVAPSRSTESRNPPTGPGTTPRTTRRPSRARAPSARRPRSARRAGTPPGARPRR